MMLHLATRNGQERLFDLDLDHVARPVVAASVEFLDRPGGGLRVRVDFDGASLRPHRSDGDHAE